MNHNELIALLNYFGYYWITSEITPKLGLYYQNIGNKSLFLL